MTDYELSRRKKTKKGYFWPKKGENEFSWTWCQYKKCRYWSKLTFYRVWAKSNDKISRKLRKTSIFDKKIAYKKNGLFDFVHFSTRS